MINLIEKYSVDSWSLDQFKALGRGKLNCEEYEIHEKDYEKLVDSIIKEVLKRGLKTKISGGSKHNKSGTILLFSPQGICYVPLNERNHYVGSVRSFSLKELIEKSNLNLDKHQRRFNEYYREL